MSSQDLIFLFLVSVIVFQGANGGKCMEGSEVEDAFIINQKCYWIIKSENITGWNGINNLCKDREGKLADIFSSSDNADLAAKLIRPAFIGYLKGMDGVWKWANSTSSFSASFTSPDETSVHIALTHTTGTWEATHVDSKKHLYNALCTLPMDPFLRCPDISVANSANDNSAPYYSGEEVTFTCKLGYHVFVGKTVQKLTCLQGRQWSYGVGDCKIIQCDYYEPPAYTERDSELYSVGDQVTYTCTDDDTWFSPGVRTLKTTCKSDGNWSPEIRPCEFFRCDPPPKLKMGWLSTTSTLYYKSIVYTCLEGYSFADGMITKTIKCDGDPLTWGPQENIDTLECLKVKCTGDPPSDELKNPLQQAPQKPQLYDVGQFQMWYCAEGYRHKDGNMGTSTECVKTGIASTPIDWIKPIPACEQVYCLPLVLQNTTSSITNPQKFYPYDLTITYNCSEPEYLFPGGYTEIKVTCNEDGHWSTSLPISGCDDSSCEVGWIKWNGACYFFSDGKSLGLRYEYAERSCNQKYANLAWIESDKEAAWIATKTYDIYKKDFWIGYHKNTDGEWIWKTDGFNNYTNFAEGYPEGYFDCARTTVKGFWKDRHCDSLMPYICKKTSICSMSPVIGHGAATALPKFPVNVGEKITYKCDDGYRFPNGLFEVTIECMEGGFWSEIENCIEDKCPPLYMETHPQYEIKGASFDNLKVAKGTVITYTCLDGQLFPDGKKTKTVTCQQGGIWSPPPPACQTLKCPIPAVPDTTEVPDANGATNVNNYGDMAYYKCQDGYSFQDAEVQKLFMCNVNGTWSPDGQVCEPRPCPVYSLKFAKAEQGKKSVYKTELRVECDYGYQFPDKARYKTVSCTASGTWSPSLPPCEPTECKGPTPPNVTDTYRDTDEIKFGTYVNYTCLYGLVYINGDTVRTAQCDPDTLEWLNVPTGCVETPAVVLKDVTHPPKEAKNAQAFGALGLAIILTALITVVILDLIMIKKYLPHIFGNKEKSAEETLDADEPEKETGRTVLKTEKTQPGQLRTAEEAPAETVPKMKFSEEDEYTDDEDGETEYETDDEEEEEDGKV